MPDIVKRGGRIDELVQIAMLVSAAERRQTIATAEAACCSTAIPDGV
jgi:hypothetical protein